MKAIRFNATIPRYALGQALGKLSPGLLWSGLSCTFVSDEPVPPLPAGDWVNIRTRYGGICGSDLNTIHLHNSPYYSPSPPSPSPLATKTSAPSPPSARKQATGRSASASSLSHCCGANRAASMTFAITVRPASSTSANASLGAICPPASSLAAARPPVAVGAGTLWPTPASSTRCPTLSVTKTR